jgi:hypothetical protein
MAGFTINNAWLTEFEAVFQTFLRYQGGGTLVNGTIQEEVQEQSKYLKRDEQYTKKPDRRRLEPRDFACPLIIDDVDTRMMGTPDIDQYASEAANSCGKIIDQIIIGGIGGGSFSEAAGGLVQLPNYSGGAVAAAASNPSAYDNTQYIAWLDYTMGDNANGRASLGG